RERDIDVRMLLLELSDEFPIRINIFRPPTPERQVGLRQGEAANERCSYDAEQLVSSRSSHMFLHPRTASVEYPASGTVPFGVAQSYAQTNSPHNRKASHPPPQHCQRRRAESVTVD